MPPWHDSKQAHDMEAKSMSIAAQKAVAKVKMPSKAAGKPVAASKPLALPKLITEPGDWAKALQSIGKRGKKLDDDIQHAALSALQQVDMGNMNWLNDLVLALPRSSRSLALKEWALAFGKCKVNDDKSKDGYFSFDKTRVTSLDEAVQIPWHEFRRHQDREAKPWDAQAATAAFVKSVSKRAHLTDDQYQELQELISMKLDQFTADRRNFVKPATV